MEDRPRAAEAAPTRKGIRLSDLMTFLLFLAAWFALQRWILPKAGVQT